MKCFICYKECIELKNHLKEHNINTKTYYDTFIKQPNEGICKICKGPTPFRGLKLGYPNTYCSNKCHGLDKDAQKLHSESLKNRSKEEKEITRNKQIDTWTKNMGENWSSIMSKKAIDSYDKIHGTNGGPFSDPIVRKKCEETWGASSPMSISKNVEKLSNSIKLRWETQEYLKNFRISFYNKTLEKYKSINQNLLDYNGVFKYICPDCCEETHFGLQFLKRRLKYGIDLCSKCVPKSGTSGPEKQLLNYIKSIYSNTIIENDKKLLTGKELDIVLPDIKLAFEYDGTYWHMDERFHSPDEINLHKQKTAKEIWAYDKLKDELCQNLNYKLIHIKEFDWLNDNENIKLYINKIINCEVIK